MRKTLEIFKRSSAVILSAAMVLGSIGIMPGGKKTASAAIADDVSSALLKSYDMSSQSGITFEGTGTTAGTVAGGELTLPGGECGSQYAVLDADFSGITDGVTVAFKTKAGATDGYSPLFCFKWDANSWSSDSSYTFDDNMNFWILRADLDTMGNVKSSAQWRDAAENPTLQISKEQYDDIAFTLSKDGINIYKNGILFKSVTAMGGGTFEGLISAIKDNAPKLRLGNIKFWAKWNDYTGSYKDVSIYKRALSAAEISYLVTGSEDKADSLISSPTATINGNQIEIGYTTDVTPDSVEVAYGDTKIEAQDGKYLYTPSAAGEYEFTITAKKEGYIADTEKAKIKVAIENEKLVLDQELVSGLKVSYDDTNLSVGWTALNDSAVTAEVATKDGEKVAALDAAGTVELSKLTNKTTYTVTATAKKDGSATKTAVKTFTYKKGKPSEVLTGTKWWDANEIGKDYPFNGNGAMILDVDYIGPETEANGAFSVELKDNAEEPLYVTTGSDVNAWGAGCGESYNYVDCTKQQNGTITPGHKYRITIERTGSEFAITYYDMTADKQHCKMTSSSCALTENFNVHVMGQIGSYQVYQVTNNVDLSADEITMNVSATRSISLTEDTYPTTTIKSVASDNEAVASVKLSEDGKVSVTGVSAGTANITVTTADDRTAAVKVTVKEIALTAFTLSESEAGITINATKFGDTYTNNTASVTPVFTPADTTQKTVTYESSDTSIATVDAATGSITALKSGTVTITANAANNLKATVTVTVNVEEKSESDLIKATKLTLDKTTGILKANETLQLTAAFEPANVSSKTLEWTSDKADVATVNASGLVTAKAIGEVTITAKTTDGSNLTATCKVKVVADDYVAVKSIELSKTEGTVEIGKTLELTAKVTPDNATNKKLVWTSSDEKIAKVSEAGVVTGVAVGEVEVTAAADGVSAKCKVTVKEASGGGTENTTIGSTDKKTAFWEAFSEHYKMSGDFNYDVEFENHSDEAQVWNNYVMVFTNQAATLESERKEGYAEYAVIRADNWGWAGGDNKSLSGDDITYQSTWADETALKDTLKDSNVKMNISRSGNVITIKETVTSLNDATKTYERTVTFKAGKNDGTDDGKGDIYFTLTVDNCYLVMKSVVDKNANQGGDTPGGDETKASLSLSKSKATLYTGKASNKTTVKATVAGASKTVSWTSSKPKVAKVSKSGSTVTITAVGKGTTTITATANGIKKTVKVTVKNPTITVKNGKKKVGKSLTVKKKKAVKLTITTSPKKAGATLAKLSKKNKKVLTASLKKGKLTIKGKKKGTVTLSIKSGKATKKIKVKVK